MKFLLNAAKKVGDILSFKRPYKGKRAYFEASYLEDFGFGIGEPIKYSINSDMQEARIFRVNDSKKRVVKTTQKRGQVKEVPVIDFKNEENLKEFFLLNQGKDMEVEFVEGEIILTVIQKVEASSQGEPLSTVEQEETIVSANVVLFKEKKEEKDTYVKQRYAISLSNVAKVSGYEQLSIFNFLDVDKKGIRGSGGSRNFIGKLIEKVKIKTASFFVGGGCMDKGFFGCKRI